MARKGPDFEVDTEVTTTSVLADSGLRPEKNRQGWKEES